MAFGLCIVRDAVHSTEFSVFTLPGTLLRASPRPINQSVPPQLREGDDIIPILEMLKLRLREEVQGHILWQDSVEPVLSHCGVCSWCCVPGAILAADLATPGAWRRRRP